MLQFSIRHQTQNTDEATALSPFIPPYTRRPGNGHPAGNPSALAGSKRGNGKTTDTAGLYKGSGQPDKEREGLAACLNPAGVAYKDLKAKSGTSTLNPTTQLDFTGQKQLTLAGEILKTRLVPTLEQQADDAAGDDGARDVRQVSFDGAQLSISYCGALAVVSECEGGHHFAKRLLCGREWCEVCGEDNSAAHKRRMARLIPKLQQCHEVGYLVIEFPKAYRHIGEAGISPVMAEGEGKGWCYSKRDLRETTSDIVNVLAGRRSAGGRGSKRVQGYFGRGVTRWHWFGDKKQGTWNPHLNVLIDSDSLYDRVRDELQPVIEAYRVKLAAGKQTKKARRELQGIEMFERRKSGYLPKPLLDRIKAELRQALNCPELIVHYEKRDTPGKIVHCVRYITRATFRDYSWNQYMAQELYDFRNIRWWGSWKGEAAWQLGQAEVEGEDIAGLQAVEKLQQGICPDCGQPLKVWHHGHNGKPVQWSRPVDSTYLLIWSAVEIAGTGYYRIPVQIPPCRSVLSPGEILRLQELVARARERPSVHPFVVAMRQPVDKLRRSTRTYKAMLLRLQEMDNWFKRRPKTIIGNKRYHEEDSEEAALDSYGDGLPIRPEAEAGQGEAEVG